MELNITVGSVVAVTNYSFQPQGKMVKYIGKVLRIQKAEDNGVLNDYNGSIIIGEGELNTKKMRISVKPYYKLRSGQYWYDSSIPDPIGEDLNYIEDPHNLSIITSELYESIRREWLNKINFLSNILFGYDDIKVERIAKKPKPFNLNNH